MGIYEGDDFEELPEVPSAPKQIVEQKPIDKTVPLQGNYDTAIIDSAYVNLRTLLTHMEGMTVTLQFYHALKGAHDQAELPDFLGDDMNTQFRYIRNLQVKFQGDKSFSKDPSKGTVSMTGSFNTYPGFTPNKYDVFVMEAGEGSRFLCYVEEVVETQHRRDRVSTCSFKVIERLTDELQKKLDERVIETVVFDKRFLSTTPYIQESQVVTLEALKNLKSYLLAKFFKQFYLPGITTFGIQDGLGIRYDELASRAFKTLMPDWGQYANRVVSQYNSGYGNDLPISIWQVLTKRAPELLPLVFRDIGWRPTKSLPVDFENFTLALTPITEYLFPKNTQHCFLPTRVLPGERALESVEEPVSSDTLVVRYVASDYKVASENDLYVFSGAFYANDYERCSKLEKMVLRYLRGEQMDPNEILGLAKEIETEFTRKQDEFYYTIVLMILIQSIV